MRRAVVHVGMPRTGTTTLQRVLTELREPLLGRGVLYPALTPGSAREAHLSHQHLGEALDGRRPARECDELLERLAAGLRRVEVDTVILSYESLVLARPRLGVARRLGDFLARSGWAMDVLVTVKPQSDYINSMYTWRTQFLKEGRDFARYARAAMGSRRLRYDALLAPWRAVAGARIVGVAVHDPADPAPLLGRILARCGLAERVGGLIDAAALALVENRSPGPLAVEASRRLAGARPVSGEAREVTRLIEKLARDGGETGGFRGVDAAGHAAIMARFTAGNERFAGMVWGRPWDACVATAPAVGCHEIGSLSSADERRVEALVAAAGERFGVRPRAMRGLRDLARDALRIA